MTKIKTKELFFDFWSDVPVTFKFGGLFLAAVFIVLAVFGWLSSWQNYAEIKRLDQINAGLETEKKAIERKLVIVAAQVKVKEAENNRLEVKKTGDEKKYVEAKNNVDSAISDYNSAVDNKRTDDTSAGKICDELAALGYRCE